MDPLQWMGAIRLRVKDITIIHGMTPVYQLLSCEVKINVFVKKQLSFNFNFKGDISWKSDFSRF